MSKGSAPRPKSVDIKTFDNNWDAIFGKKKKEDVTLVYNEERLVSKEDKKSLSKEKKEKKVQVRVNEDKTNIGSCGCGRSPNGKCVGWHGLTEEAYREELAKYEDRQNKPNKPLNESK